MNQETFEGLLAYHFTQRSGSGGFTEFVHGDEGPVFFIAKVNEEPLSFGEALGYAPERAQPSLSLAEALYRTCYEDEHLAEVLITAGGANQDSDGLRELLEESFAFG